MFPINKKYTNIIYFLKYFLKVSSYQLKHTLSHGKVDWEHNFHINN